MIENSKSTSDLVAEKIRQSIIIGEFANGEALKQDVLAELYDVSKIPVREALYQLKTEGLVSFKNNRGSTVSSLSRTEVEEIYIMRIALEEIALKRAIPKLQPENLIAAESALKLLDTSSNYSHWPALNWEFHASLYKAANMPKLLDTVSVLHNNVSRYLLLYLKKMDFQQTSQQEHWDLLAACSDGKPKEALKILRKHMQDALHQTLLYMK
ncbi:MAG: GntR family transcriptional regulator [Alcanivoracaceae bacterium]|nr:GntR family transcriptional regulator [Alcanivoracaceae bacterium]